MNTGRRRPAHSPLSTYRIQFNRTFTFRDAVGVIPYLHELGVDWLYASPYLRARPGSMHGYDILDHNQLNPEIGTLEDHSDMVGSLSGHGMGHLLDIVPNHMGIGQQDNTWWMDVLEHGQSSAFAPFFDIDWRPLKPELAGKVLLPVLGDQFGEVLERGELTLTQENGVFSIVYGEQRFPVSPRSLSLVLRATLDRLGNGASVDDETRAELESIVTAIEHLPGRHRTDPTSVAERKRESIVTRRRIAALTTQSPPVRDALEKTITDFNGVPGDPSSFDRLDRVLDDQAYRLAHWRVAAEEINYRRFFDINELAGVRVERGEVFQNTHKLVLQLVAEGKVHGLRIDHPDGLYDPKKYLRDLQTEASRRAGDNPVYVVVEKILTGDERLPEDWETDGSVGYDFLNRLNALFVDRGNEQAMTALYEQFTADRRRYSDVVYRKKKLILRAALASELHVLSYHLDRISENNRRFRDFTLGSLTEALGEAIACFPVYRTYIDAVAGRISSADREFVERAIRAAIRRNPAMSRTVFEFIQRTLLLEWPDSLDEEAREQHASFVMKFQQLTGPVMAKGLEDTTFYLYNRLISLNEVGGDPSRFGTGVADFHAWTSERGDGQPQTMNATSTHDTKRSEDVRARINVLSEIPEEWGARVRRWAELNRRHKKAIDDEVMPDESDEYLLYQTLVGAWPLDAEGGENAKFVERIQAYMEKATREAKVHTSWINPNEAYDSSLRDFVGVLLDPARSSDFLADLKEFHQRVSRIGMLNSLSQTLLKLTLPGVPDIYQGQELWDFSLVDPDNRRPVDFEARRSALSCLKRDLSEKPRSRVIARLMEDWQSGLVKLYLTHLLLTYRREHGDLFRSGAYIPLAASGPRGDRIVAFAREHGGDSIIAVAPRLWGGMLWGDGNQPGGDLWRGTTIRVPQDNPTRYRNLLTGREVTTRGEDHERVIAAEETLADFPVAFLVRE